MKNFLIVGLALITIAGQTAFASFSDLQESHKNYDAIIYLQENGVINGYEDGTFKPENAVNRAEFLKIIIEGSNIPKDAEEYVPFSDVDNLAWYAPYLKKAYKEGWVDGYPDGSFKPSQTINKAEALKILGGVQDWEVQESLTSNPFDDADKNAWFAKYVDYAKNHEYLEEEGPNLSPDSLMTRANISEVIYRTLVENTSNNQSEDDSSNEELIEPDDNEEKNENLNFEPIEETSIDKNFYSNITLAENIPNTFYKNEVFDIEGTVSTGNYETISIIVDPIDDDDNNYETFSGDIKNKSFEVPVYFNKSGNYYLGLLLGGNGDTKLEEISVLPSLPDKINETSAPQKIESFAIDYENDKTFVNFDNQENTIKELTIYQNSDSVTYLTRQSLDKIIVRYTDFEDFGEKETGYYLEIAALNSEIPLEISSDFIKSDTKTFIALEHTFDNISEDDIEINPPDLISSTGDFSISGSTKSDTQTLAYIIKPDGFIAELELDTNATKDSYFGVEIIGSGETFSIDYDAKTKGRYILEINSEEGIALVNHPIYIGGGIPLVPDYFDLNERYFFSGSLNLTNLRNQLLNLINDSREEHGLSSISSSDELNTLAQSHSDDMAENNFFSHYNLQDQSPEDRRIEAGIATPVSENIAKDVDITFAHLGLMRSAAHRSNILDESWTRVGLGITLEDGYLYIAEEFSTSELTAADLASYKTELFDAINDLRAGSSLSALTEELSLDNACTSLNDVVIDDGGTLTNEIFTQTLTTYEITGSSEAIGRTYNEWDLIKDSILEDETSLLEAVWEKIGIDIQLDNNGGINTMIIINNP